MNLREGISAKGKENCVICQQCVRNHYGKKPCGFYRTRRLSSRRCSSSLNSVLVVVTKRFRRFRKWCQFSRCNDETTSAFRAFSDTIRNTRTTLLVKSSIWSMIVWRINKLFYSLINLNWVGGVLCKSLQLPLILWDFIIGWSLLLKTSLSTWQTNEF